MTCLAIDTAGPFCSAALVVRSDPQHPLAAESEQIGRGHAERLMPMIGSVLAGAGMTYDDLSLIAVTTGPGSFTGVRIGISAARGLALALGLEARGIGVLDVLAEQAFSEQLAEGTVVAALEAGRGDLFVQIMHGAAGTVVLPAARMPAAEAAAEIGGLAGPVSLTGSGAPALMASAGAGVEWKVIGDADHADIATLAAMAVAGAGFSPPRPLYLRAPDAKPQSGKAVAHA
jgi:tRNA threonylcarbamoyladenosine biosynthesis protein TsaB